MARKKKPEEHVNHERWLVSYADFITLLFAFFTTMYAIGESDRGKAEKFIHSVNNAFHRFDTIMPADVATASTGRIGAPVMTRVSSGAMDVVYIFKEEAPQTKGPEESGPSNAGRGEGEGEGINSLEEGGREATEFQGYGPEQDASGGSGSEAKAPPKPTPDPTPPPTPTPDPTPTPPPTPTPGAAGAPSGSGGMSGSEAQQALDELQKYLAEENLADEVVLKREDRGLVVSLSEAGFFEPGKAQLKPGSDAMLDRIARMVKRMNRPIQIDGHTDNTPIRYSAFRSNLELSIARAAETYGALVERYGLEPAHIGAAGWGEWRPIASNDTPEGRARNRRVDIVILGSDLPSVLPAPTP